MTKLKSILCTSLFSLVLSISFSQEIEYSFEKELPIYPSKSFEVDNLGNIYLISDYTIYKLSPKGDTMYVYSAKNHGVITHLDISIPQKPLLLFKESGILLELDFTLTENASPIYLFQKGILRPTYVRHAFNNGGYWIYDAAKFELINLDKNFNLSTKTGNFQLLTTIKQFNPSEMWIYDDKIHLSDSTNGVLVFDIFGTFIKKYPWTEFSEIGSLFNGYIYQKNKNVFYINAIEFFPIESIKVPVNSFATKFLDDKVYFLSTKSITIYKLREDKNK